MADHLVPPYGGALVDIIVDDERASELRKASTDWPSWDLTPRHLCDGTLWPIPVTLDVPDDLATKVGPGASVALRDAEGVMLAALHVGEVYRPDLRAEAQAVFGTTDPA